MSKWTSARSRWPRTALAAIWLAAASSAQEPPPTDPPGPFDIMNPPGFAVGLEIGRLGIRVAEPLFGPLVASGDWGIVAGLAAGVAETDPDRWQAMVQATAPDGTLPPDGPPVAGHPGLEAGLSIGRLAGGAAVTPMFGPLVAAGEWEPVAGLALALAEADARLRRAAAVARDPDRIGPSATGPDGQGSRAVARPAERASAARIVAPQSPMPGPGPSETASETPASSGPDPIGNDTFWMRLGDGEAPGVYMLADPGCPHCAAALEGLSDDISAGRLHVRLALAPVLRGTTGLAATIMVDPQPAEAAWAMLLDAAAGQAPRERAGAGAAIGDVGMRLLQSNLDWMRAAGVTAVPHFVWHEKGGWMQATGVQPPGRFAGALTLDRAEAAMSAPDELIALLAREVTGDGGTSIPPLPGG